MIIRKVVILEDEDILGKLYASKLEEEGYSVKLFKDAKELMMMCVDDMPDLVFLDLNLRGDNEAGISIIPNLKKLNPTIKIVVLSNYSAFQMAEKAIKAGALDYLLKINTSPSLLVTYIRKLAAHF